MLVNNDSDWNIEDLTDTEIYAAIRYLEPDPSCANGENGDILSGVNYYFPSGFLIVAHQYSHNQTETP
jgi:hypothetical protein